MSEERMIIPKRPQHHKLRFAAAVTVCGLAVVGVWGLQMKSTFQRYAAERAEVKESQALIGAEGGGLKVNTNAAEIQDNVDNLQNMIEEMAREELAKQEALEAVKNEMSKMSAPEPEGTGVVAGETTEVIEVPVAN